MDRLYPITTKSTTAPGFRNGTSGVLYYIGNSGFSWSCTPVADAVTMRYLDFYTQGLNPSSVNHRGHGFQLRCLSE